MCTERPVRNPARQAISCLEREPTCGGSAGYRRGWKTLAPCSKCFASRISSAGCLAPGGRARCAPGRQSTLSSMCCERRQTMNIITNRIPRPLQCLYDLPLKAAKDFGYIDDAYEPRLVCYRGQWYDVWDSMRCPGAEAPEATRHAFAGWDGYVSGSFFSGVLFKFADESAEGDACVVVGRYCC